jgi:CheY-like chemotaxis protein
MAKRVLIVDDEKEMHLIYKTTLNNSGITFDDAYDGSEAYQKVKANQYDLILLDLVMPDINGFEFLDLAKEDKINLPFIIICSSMREKEIVMAALQLGASDYLFKPVEPVKLRQVIGNYLDILKQTEADFNSLKESVAKDMPTLGTSAAKAMPAVAKPSAPHLDSVAKAISYMVFNRHSGKVTVSSSKGSGLLDYQRGKLQKVQFGAKSGIDALEEIKFLTQFTITIALE